MTLGSVMPRERFQGELFSPFVGGAVAQACPCPLWVASVLCLHGSLLVTLPFPMGDARKEGAVQGHVADQGSPRPRKEMQEQQASEKGAHGTIGAGVEDRQHLHLHL